MCTKRGLLDGTAADPLTDEESVLALVPVPRFHRLRYHRVMAARACAGGRIVPAKPVSIRRRRTARRALRPAAIS